MRIAVVGAGAVGSLLGALLARGTGWEAGEGQAGEDRSVVIIDRGVRFDDLQDSSELVVKSNYVSPFTVDITLEPGLGGVAIADSPARTAELLKGPADVVLLCVKSYHTRQALQELEEAVEPPLVGPETLVVSCQNGVDNEPAIAGVFGWERTAGGVVVVAASLEADGAIRCDRPPKVDLGLFGPEGTPAPTLAPSWALARLEALAEALNGAGIRARVVGDIQARLWRKLVSNAAMNPLTAITGRTLDEVAASPGLMELVESAMREAVAVGRAQGHSIPDKVIDLSLQAMGQVAGFAPSMLQDQRAGRRLELDGLVGAVTRRAREHDLPTPVLDTLEALLAGMTQGKD